MIAADGRTARRRLRRRAPSHGSIHRAAIATLLCVGAIAAAGCGNESDDVRASASRQDGGRSVAKPALVEVPEVTGQTAEEASSTLEAAGFEPTFDPEPDDASLCTVSQQDQSGEIEEGSEVILTLECVVDVPDVSDEPADDAVAKLEELGLTTSYETEPDDSSRCKVEDQDVVGEAAPESEVVLSLICKLPNLTGGPVERAVSELERIGYDADHPPVDDRRACTVTSHRSEAKPGATIELAVNCASGSSARPIAP